jgi:hypothetical protein
LKDPFDERRAPSGGWAMSVWCHARR